MYELQTWVRMAAGNGQDILQCPRHWQKAELETTGEAQGSWQLAVGPSRGAVPAEMPGSLSLSPRATAWGRHQLGIR